MVLTEEDEHEIMFYSLRHSSPVTLRELYQFGVQAKNKQTILIAAQYLHEELPIRLARCMLAPFATSSSRQERLVSPGTGLD